MKQPVIALLLVMFSAVASAQVHVSPTGDDSATGGADSPVATIERAVAIADQRGGAQTIVLHAGTYDQGANIPARDNAPVLTVTAAPREGGGFARVVFECGYNVHDAEPVEGMPGVYRTPIPTGFNAYKSRRSMWEADTRTRYRRMADVRAVAAYPASYHFEPIEYFDDRGWVYFHTSDGQPPQSHEVGFTISDRGFRILRDNVTVRGMHLQNGGGFGVIGDNIVLEDCSAWNIDRTAVYVSAACMQATVRRFTATDVGGGIYSEGKHTVIEDCRLFRAQDDFESHEGSQDATAGIQIYTPATTGEIRGNLTVGFRLGIFIKKTPDAPVTIENNTCYGGRGGESFGISVVRWFEGSVIRNNIVTGHSDAYSLSGFTNYSHNVVFRDNLLWDVDRRGNVDECMTIAQAAGSGQGIVHADPRFAAPHLGDFRLLPDSPALRGDGTQLGALGPVDDDWQDKQAPTLTLSLDKPATRLGRTVERHHRTDHWQPGGGDRELRETLFESDAGNQWLVPDAKLTLACNVADNASKITQMKLRIGEGAWSDPMPFAWSKTIDLPAGAIDTTIAVTVADAAGNWSKPVALRAFRADVAPKLAGEPHVYVTRNGVAVAFETNVPCTATLAWGVGDELDQIAQRPPNVYRSWDSEFGEWTEVRTGPRQAHVLAVQAPTVEPGATLRYRIVLDDGIGHVHQTEPASVTLSGEPLTITIDPAGEDRDGADMWRSLQFAADRALPGDRIVLRDGLYTDPTVLLRGGAPLVIEAEHAGKATLDVGKLHRNAVRLHRTPHVTLRGLEIRWFDNSGLQITESPHVTLDNIEFWNELLIQGRRRGTAYFARESPDLTVRQSLFYFMNNGFVMLDSPRFRFEQNTIVKLVHSGCVIIFSSRDSVMVNNCFAFTGNEHLRMFESPEDWETFTCDYNNYPAAVRDLAPRRPAPEVDIGYPGPWGKTAKRVNRMRLYKDGAFTGPITGFSLAEWQKVSGKDAHSLFKRPLFIDPYARNWRIEPDSPNIGAGRDGALIGALGPVESH